MNIETLKLQHEDKFIQWIEDNKFTEIEEWSQGERCFCEDTYEDCMEIYIEDNAEELWKEYLTPVVWKQLASEHSNFRGRKDYGHLWSEAGELLEK